MQINDSNIPVIIIDDEPGILFLHELMVTESNLSDQVSTFSNPVEGLEFITQVIKKSSRILILLDINMPEMTGWQILEKLDELKINDRVTVIMATSSIQKSDRVKSQNYPSVKMYLEKPIDLDACLLIKESLM